MKGMKGSRREREPKWLEKEERPKGEGSPLRWKSEPKKPWSPGAYHLLAHHFVRMAKLYSGPRFAWLSMDPKLPSRPLSSLTRPGLQCSGPSCGERFVQTLLLSTQ